MVRYMNATGFGVFSFDAEGGDCQYEFDFQYREALELCDQLTLFRLMAKRVAKQEDMFVTFMPKPYTGAWGSGAHFNMSIEDLDTGQPLPRAATPAGGAGASWPTRSSPASSSTPAWLRSATDGELLQAAGASPGRRHGVVGAVWAAYGDNSRSCMVRPRRPPSRTGVDSRPTYLAGAFLLAAGRHRPRARSRRTGRGPPTTGPAWTDRGDIAPPAARTLLEAIGPSRPIRHRRDLHPVVRLGLRRDEAERVGHCHSQVTDWERSKYLELF
jgi:glutamine synthetase